MTCGADYANTIRRRPPAARRLAVLGALLASAALVGMPGPASAQSNDTGAAPPPPATAGGTSIGRRYERVTGPDIRRLLRKMGHPARLYRDKKGKPRIESRLEGKTFRIGFYSCSKAAVPRCQSIQLYSGYRMRSPVSYATLNSWNSERRYARAYRQPDNPRLVFLELDVPFQGVSDMTFRKQLDMFRRLNALFRKKIGFGN